MLEPAVVPAWLRTTSNPSGPKRLYWAHVASLDPLELVRCPNCSTDDTTAADFHLAATHLDQNDISISLMFIWFQRSWKKNRLRAVFSLSSWHDSYNSYLIKSVSVHLSLCSPPRCKIRAIHPQTLSPLPSCLFLSGFILTVEVIQCSRRSARL